MGRHNGKNGTVTLAGNAVVALTGFDIEETVEVQKLGAAGDDWETKDTGIKDWKGSIKMNADHGANGQTLRVGDVVPFNGYTEGDASGRTYLSGEAIIVSHGVDHTHNGVVTRSYSIEGNGPLSIQQVA